MRDKSELKTQLNNKLIELEFSLKAAARERRDLMDELRNSAYSSDDDETYLDEQEKKEAEEEFNLLKTGIESDFEEKREQFLQKALELALDVEILEQATTADLIKMVTLFPESVKIINQHPNLFQRFEHFHLLDLATHFPAAFDLCIQYGYETSQIFAQIIDKGLKNPYLAWELLKSRFVNAHFTENHYLDYIKVILQKYQVNHEVLSAIHHAHHQHKAKMKWLATLTQVALITPELEDYLLSTLSIKKDLDVYQRHALQFNQMQRIGNTDYFPLILEDWFFGHYLQARQAFPALNTDECKILIKKHPLLITTLYHAKQIVFTGIGLIKTNRSLRENPQAVIYLLEDKKIQEEICALSNRSIFIKGLIDIYHNAALYVMDTPYLANMLGVNEIESIIHTYPELSAEILECHALRTHINETNRTKLKENIHLLGLVSRRGKALLDILNNAYRFNQFFQTETRSRQNTLLLEALENYSEHRTAILTATFKYPGELERLIPTDKVFAELARLSAEVGNQLISLFLESPSDFLGLVARSCSTKTFNTLALSLSEPCRDRLFEFILSDQRPFKNVFTTVNSLIQAMNLLPHQNNNLGNYLLSEPKVFQGLDGAIKDKIRLVNAFPQKYHAQFLDLIMDAKQFTFAELECLIEALKEEHAVAFGLFNNLLQKEAQLRILFDTPNKLCTALNDLEGNHCSLFLNSLYNAGIFESLVANFTDMSALFRRLSSMHGVELVRFISSQEPLLDVLIKTEEDKKNWLELAAVKRMEQIKARHNLTLLGQAYRNENSAFYTIPQEVVEKIALEIPSCGILSNVDTLTFFKKRIDKPQKDNYLSIPSENKYAVMDKLHEHALSTELLSVIIEHSDYASYLISQDRFPKDYSFADYKQIITSHPKLLIELHHHDILRYGSELHQLMLGCPEAGVMMLQSSNYTTQLYADNNINTILCGFACINDNLAMHILTENELSKYLKGSELVKIAETYPIMAVIIDNNDELFRNLSEDDQIFISAVACSLNEDSSYRPI